MTLRLPRLLPLLLLPLALRAQTVPLPEAACRAALDALDTAYAHGDAEGYAACFAPEVPWLHRQHCAAIAARLRAAPGAVRRSEMVAQPRLVGERTVVLVGTTTTAATGSVALHERNYLVLRGGDGATAVPVACVELPPRYAPCGDERLACPPCGLRLGGVPGWLCAPLAADRAGGVDGAMFLLLGTDVGLEVGVAFADEAETAARVASALADGAASQEAGAHVGPVAVWRPPHLAPEAVLPAAFSAACVAVDLPHEQRLEVFALVFGRLRHCLLLRGSSRALAVHRPAIDALLASYEPPVPAAGADAAAAAEPAAVFARALAAHTGGALADGCYRNERYGVLATGPAGWAASEGCAGCAFQVRWTAPTGGAHLWLRGQPPPSGLPRWTEAMADRWLAALLIDSGFQVLAAAGDAWCGTGEDRERSCTATAADGRRRHLRMLLRRDLLVVADAVLPAGADPAPVLKALAGVQRH